MLAEIFGVDGVIVLIVVVVLLFGGAAIPKLARNLGSAKNEFEKGLEDGKKASAPRPAASNGTACRRGDAGPPASRLRRPTTPTPGSLTRPWTLGPVASTTTRTGSGARMQD